MIAETDAAYIAGIIDGEGHIECVRRKEKRQGKRGEYFSNSMRICIRVQMTDKSVLLWMREVIGMGTVRKRNRSASIKSHGKIVGYTQLDLERLTSLLFDMAFGTSLS